jgi:hypothetical protein
VPVGDREVTDRTVMALTLMTACWPAPLSSGK